MRACRSDLHPDFDPQGPTADYVRGVVLTFLDRDPSTAELTQLTVALDSTVLERGQLTRSLSQSLEWIGLTVDALYRSALGRDSDDAGRRYWRERVVGGMRITDVGAWFYGSEEFGSSGWTTSPWPRSSRPAMSTSAARNADAFLLRGPWRG